MRKYFKNLAYSEEVVKSRYTNNITCIYHGLYVPPYIFLVITIATGLEVKCNILGTSCGMSASAWRSTRPPSELAFNPEALDFNACWLQSLWLDAEE